MGSEGFDEFLAAEEVVVERPVRHAGCLHHLGDTEHLAAFGEQLRRGIKECLSRARFLLVAARDGR